MPNYIPKSNTKELGKIRVKKQNRDSTAAVRRKVISIDTETHDGNIFLIADSDSHILEYPNISFESVAKFLLRFDEDYWVFFYNLGYDAECILKLIPADVLKSQYVRNDRQLTFEYKGYSIRYIDRKQLTIRRGKHSVSCYDIAQYYDNRPLDKAYLEYIKRPLDAGYIETKLNRNKFTLRYFLRNKNLIKQYCVTDCRLTKDLAENWLDTFHRVFGFYTRNWISSGYLAEKVLINNNVPVPFFHEVPYEVQDIAWKSFYGGRFELIQRGFIGKCFLYDLNSAYPFALTKLPDITKGKWLSSDKVIPNAALGFFHILADIDDSVKIAPFPFRTKDNRIIYPVGEFETFITLEELKAIAGDDRIRYKVLDSYQFILNKKIICPFKYFIEHEYYRRLELKDNNNPLERAIKIILNSVYGKMAQRKNNVMGNLFNPVIASFITGFTRAQLYIFMKKYELERSIVAFATDSVAVRAELPGLDSKDLGEMKLDKYANDVIFLSNGFYMFNGKWKQRGVGYDREKKAEIEHLDTRINNDGQLHILVKTTRTTHIKSGILYNKLKSVGKIEQYEKKIGLNSDKKRFWPDELKTLHDKSFCDSAPLNINSVADIISKKSDVAWEDEQEEKYEPESEL